MGSLRGRLRRLEEATRAAITTVVCPRCSEEFRVGADTGLDYLVWWWSEEGEAESHRETPPDVLRLVAHPHDASLFVLEEDGSPWLGEFFRGIEQEPRDVEDLSE